MTEPRLFVDLALLGALLVEFEDELGEDAARRTLFQIGLIHGLRDAARVVGQSFLSSAEVPDERPSGAAARRERAGCEREPLGQPGFTPLLMDLSPSSQDENGIAIQGRWPELHEAAAWLNKFGPAEEGSCWLSCGYTSGWLSGSFEIDLIALESCCATSGDDECHFVAREPEAWEAQEPGRIAASIGEIDFDFYRALVLRCPTGPAPEMVESQGDFDPDATLVHIWGPVMVLPFTGEDEILRTTEALSRDPSTQEVGAVVVDLREQNLDEGFGSAAIERVLETIEAWGAEPIITGVAPFAEAAVHGLESTHLLVRKDLTEAIAAAFLIAEAQKHAA